MSNTGFSTTRADRHDRLVKRAVRALTERGFTAKELPVDGDRPDIEIRDANGRTAYVDLKVAYSSHRNFAIKLGAFETAMSLTSQGTPVYIVSVHDKDAFVDTPHTYLSRVEGGPRRPTGNGSRTDWMLARPGGTPFDEFFPPVKTKPSSPIVLDEHPDFDILPTAAQARDWPNYQPDPEGWTS